MEMDLADPLNITKSDNKYILVIQDYFSKWIELFPLVDKTTKGVADILVKEYFTHYGLCECLHSDQGLEFYNIIIQEVCNLWALRRPELHPLPSGQMEWWNEVTAPIYPYVPKCHPS